jgi:hypothetical protein
MNILLQCTRRAIVLAGFAAFAAITPVSHAQYSSTMGTLRVPFAFNYGSRHFKPGKYLFIRQGQNIVMVRSLDGLNTAMAIVQVERAPHPLAQGKAVFQRADGDLVLREFWMQDEDEYLHTITRKAKKHAELASGKAMPTQVELSFLNRPAPGAR